MDRALEHFRRVAKQADNPFARAAEKGREIICEAIRILYTPYAPPGKGLSPPALRPEGLPDALGFRRALSRMVKDAARVETPPLRGVDARYGHLTKYNLPLSKAGVSVVGAPQSPDPRPPAPDGAQPKSSEPVATRPNSQELPRVSYARPTFRDRGPQHGRGFKGSKRKSRRSRGRSRAKVSFSAGSSGDKKVREPRLAARLAGGDEKGSLRDKCENRYMVLGTHVPRHQGCTRQDLGNMCYSPRRDPGREGRRVSLGPLLSQSRPPGQEAALQVLMLWPRFPRRRVITKQSYNLARGLQICGLLFF